MDFQERRLKKNVSVADGSLRIGVGVDFSSSTNACGFEIESRFVWTTSASSRWNGRHSRLSGEYISPTKKKRK